MKDDSFDCTLIAHLRIFLLFYRLLYCLILPENRLFFGIWKVVEIDAEENPYEVIVSNRLYEQQKYIVETNHLPHLISLIVNDDFYQELPEETKTIINEAAQTAKIKARQASDERIEEKMKVIEESGTEIITLSDELHQQIREAAQPVYDVIGAQVDKDIVTAYLSD